MNKTHYEFFDKVRGEISHAGADVKNAIQQFTPEFNKWIAEEQANLDWVRTG
ncbi:MAG: hypothetical protein LBE71_06535 [Dysgonamonadaceae bacterium]|nr:hypothetical protein [Dysgonamonadaceae bacterium]